jgi:formylglycine-generating enzyme required for sulfatase activity
MFIIIFLLALCNFQTIATNELTFSELVDGQASSSSCGCSVSRDTANNPSKLIDNSVKLLHEKSFSKSIIKIAYIPGGDGFIGTDRPYIRVDGESPRRPVTLSSFYIDKFEVSNEGSI